MPTGIQARPHWRFWTLVGVIIIGQLLGEGPVRAQKISATISNDISKGTELLSNQDVMQRIAGVYLLSNAATQIYLASGDSKSATENMKYYGYYDLVFRTLGAFVRHHIRLRT